MGPTDIAAYKCIIYALVTDCARSAVLAQDGALMRAECVRAMAQTTGLGHEQAKRLVDAIYNRQLAKLWEDDE